MDIFLQNSAITHFSDSSITISTLYKIDSLALTEYKISVYIINDLTELKMRNRNSKITSSIVGCFAGGVLGALIGASTADYNPNNYFSVLDALEPTSKGLLAGFVVGGAIGGIFGSTIAIPLENKKLLERKRKLNKFYYLRYY